MNYTYLFVNLALLLLPVVLFSIRQLNFTDNSKFIILGVLISVFAFSIPTEFLTQLKVIVFNPPYLSGMTLWQLPIEELLLSFILPLCGLAIYLFLNYRFPDNSHDKYSLAFSNIMLGVSIVSQCFIRSSEIIYFIYVFDIICVYPLHRICE
ncbi:lycopene cyclase domain-containing protein [Pedobacter sp. NJ-S-72]